MKVILQHSHTHTHTHTHTHAHSHTHTHTHAHTHTHTSLPLSRSQAQPVWCWNLAEQADRRGQTRAPPTPSPPHTHTHTHTDLSTHSVQTNSHQSGRGLPLQLQTVFTIITTLWAALVKLVLVLLQQLGGRWREVLEVQRVERFLAVPGTAGLVRALAGRSLHAGQTYVQSKNDQTLRRLPRERQTWGRYHGGRRPSSLEISALCKSVWTQGGEMKAGRDQPLRLVEV